MARTLPEGHVYIGPEYNTLLPKSVPVSRESISRGRQLAYEAAERLRAASSPLGELAVTPPAESCITDEERRVYINNPGHNPYLAN